jgi:ParB-like chromosome segregation protein Spo0J
MTRPAAVGPVRMAFEPKAVKLPIADIQPLRPVTRRVRKSPKYAQIAASISEIGLVEPPVVARDRGSSGKYLLLDGHLRIDVLKDMDVREVTCLVSTDDEAFTYNRRVNRIAIVQEHKMILKAIERGVSEERLARALNVNVEEIRRKRRLLERICPEAAELLKDRQVPIVTFSELKKMAPLRQIEAAELMIAMNKFTIKHARSLVAATPPEQLKEGYRKKVVKGLNEKQIALMEWESANLEREFKMAERSYGADHLDLVLTKGYLGKLLGNARIVRYLAQHHPELLDEFERIAELEPASA